MTNKQVQTTAANRQNAAIIELLLLLLVPAVTECINSFYLTLPLCLNTTDVICNLHLPTCQVH